MKYKLAITTLLALTLTLGALPSFGQHGAGVDRARHADRDRSRRVDRDRTFDRDRGQDWARMGVPERDRDRLNMRDPFQMKDEDIYGNRFMTAAERRQYRDQLRKMDTPEARISFQVLHEETMRNRALVLGQDLVPPGQGPVYGGEFMTVQERNRYREQLRWLDSEKERKRFIAKHRKRMDKRAHALGHVIEKLR